MLHFIRQTVMMLVLLGLITGLAYPLLVTGIAQVTMPRQANGSLLERNGQEIGSELLGQPFNDPKYFWSRPSATTPVPYNGMGSTGSNLGPTNPELAKQVQAHVQALRQGVSASQPSVPVDMVTASASGLDPDISPAAAEFQISRVAKARNIDEHRIGELVARHTHARELGILGEPRVNVLALNLALDEMQR